jgi:hypothetical protein
MTDSPELSVLSLKNKSGSKADRSQQDEKERNLRALCDLATLGISTLGLCVSIAALFTARTIANKPMPSLVQTLSGKAMKVEATNDYERSPRVIKYFVLNTLTNLFTWRVNYLPPSAENPRGAIDPGVPVEVDGKASVKIPTSVWGASFAISDDFRKDFLGKSLAPLIANLKIVEGSSYVSFIPGVIQDPIEIKGKDPNERRWKVKVVGTLAVKTAINVPETLVPINKDIYVRAVAPPIPPDPNAVDAKSDMQTVIAIARSSGMEIDMMEDYAPQTIPSTERTPTPTSTK